MPVGLARRRTIAPSGSTVYVSDTFQRADSSTSIGTADTGQAWTNAASGVVGIQTHRAYAPVGARENEAYVDASHANVSVISVANSTNAGNADNGLIARTTTGFDFFLWRYNSSGAQLYRRGGGNYTQLGSFSFSPGTTSHTMKLTLTGTSLTGFVDGVSRVSVTDSQNQTSTTHGLRLGAVAADIDFCTSFQVTP